MEFWAVRRDCVGVGLGEQTFLCAFPFPEKKETTIYESLKNTSRCTDEQESQEEKFFGIEK